MYHCNRCIYASFSRVDKVKCYEYFPVAPATDKDYLCMFYTRLCIEKVYEAGFGFIKRFHEKAIAPKLSTVCIRGELMN